MGECESERTERDFQSMKAVERTRAKLRDCVSVRRMVGETIVACECVMELWWMEVCWWGGEETEWCGVW